MDLTQITLRSPITSAVTGGGACGYNVAGTSQNSDGSASAVTMTTPALVTPPIQCAYTTVIYGTHIGIRCLSLPTTPEFDLIVDGEVFPVRNIALTHNGMPALGNAVNNDGHYIIPIEFEDTVHTVTVVLTAKATVQTLVVFGWIADRQHYLREPQSILVPTATTEVGTNSITPAKLPRSVAGANDFRGFGKLVYANTGESEAVVRVLSPTNVVMWIKKIPALDTVDIDLDEQLVALNPNCAHYASAPGVMFTVFGGW